MFFIMRREVNNKESRYSKFVKARFPLPLHTEFERENFSSLNNPASEIASKAKHMDPDDKVIGIYIRGVARAYPLWIISGFPVVNDTFKKTAVVLIHSQNNTAAFVPMVDLFPNRTISFTTCDHENGNFNICDIQTQTHWDPYRGVAIKGPLRGSLRKPIPFKLTTWKEWKIEYPETDVLYAPTSLKKKFNNLL